MKLAEARAAYEDLSGLASDVSRKLCLAGIGLIWFLSLGPALQ
jgi:hypothetical protein